ncbi:MAG: hypothetical protein U5O39_11775 [Gammaproteobacteria bacterium]|nr:hypothetical protein [Gammaproteobacteria bacterium]
MLDTTGGNVVTMTVTAGNTLTNNGQFRSEGAGTTTAAHTFIGSMDGTGTFDFDQDTDYQGSLNVANATLDVASGTVLGFGGSSVLTIGSGTTLTGTGTIGFSTGTSTVSVTETTTLGATSPFFDLSGASVSFSGVGPLSLGLQSSVLQLSGGDAINVPLTNNGFLEAQSTGTR